VKKKILLIAGPILAVVILVMVGFMVISNAKQPLVLRLSVGGAEASASETETPAGTHAAPATEAERTATVPRADPESVPPASGVLVDLGSKVINLADPGGYRYVRLGLVMEFAPKEMTFYTAKAEERKKQEDALREEVTRQKAVIEDAVIGIVSNKAFGDIFNLKGKDDLKEELRTAVDGRLPGMQVLRVYFTDFLVQ
jgi:flagellar protein FliL